MPSLQTYLVGNDGYIDFPIIGKIQVAGNTRKQLEDKIQKELEPAFNMEHPVINIRFTNYYVNILGEVARPGRYETPNDRLTIFEGLAMAGDLTIYGRRDNIKVLRENIDGTKTLIHLNLRDANIVQSPAYFLQQNDVVYVEPNKSRARSSSINSAETLTVSAVSIVISLASLLVNILYK
jgi:polysaccharide export outer membrane protein